MRPRNLELGEKNGKGKTEDNAKTCGGLKRILSWFIPFHGEKE